MPLNLADERLKNPKVRLAMKYLVDYQGMVNTFLKGRFLVQQAFLPIGIFGAIPYNPYKLDVAKAKALLAEAGYPNGFELRLDVANTSPLIDIAQSVQQTMGLAGIKVNIVSADAKQVIGHLPRPQAPGGRDQLDTGLSRPAQQRRHLRA